MTCSEPNGEVGVGISPVWLSILVVLWSVTLLLFAFSGRSPRRRPMAFFFLAVSGAATVGGYGVRRSLDRATGIPDGAILADHLLGLLGVVAMLELAATLAGVAATTRRTLRRAQLVLALDMVLLVVLFAVIPRRLDQPDFGCWHARSVLVVAYQLLYQAALGTGLGVAIMLFRPRVHTADKLLVRNVLRLLVAAFAVGLAYVAVRCWYLVTHAFALPYPLDGRYGFVPVVLLESGLALFGLGAFLLGAYRTGLFLRRLTTYHRLRPLWKLLSEAAPGHVLGAPPPLLADLLMVRGIERRLYRRAIEIRDAQWELTGYLTQAMTESAALALRDAELPPHADVSLTLEALAVEMAHRAKSAGLPRPDVQGAVVSPGGADLDTEAAILLTIQRLRNDPWVRTTAEAIVPGGGRDFTEPMPSAAR